MGKIGDSRANLRTRTCHEATVPDGECVPSVPPDRALRAMRGSLFAPEWSEYFDDRRIRHFWSCDACNYQFETMVCYPAANAQAA